MLNFSPTPNAPDWLIDRLTATGQKISNTNAAPSSFLKEGSRNSDLTSFAGFLRRKNGLDADGIFAIIDPINQNSSNPLPVGEVRAVASSVANYSTTDTPSLLDVPLSRYVAKSIAPKCRYVPEWGWMNWVGTRWISDLGGIRTRELVKQCLEAIFERIKNSGDLDTANKSRSLMSAGKIKAVTGLIEGDPELLTKVTDFDAIEDILNVTNGTLDLRTLDLDHHQPDDLLTKVSGTGVFSQ